MYSENIQISSCNGPLKIKHTVFGSPQGWVRVLIQIGPTHTLKLLYYTHCNTCYDKFAEINTLIRKRIRNNNIICARLGPYVQQMLVLFLRVVTTHARVRELTIYEPNNM